MQGRGAPFTTAALAVGTIEFTKEHTRVIESKLDEVSTVFDSTRLQTSEKNVEITGKDERLNAMPFPRESM
jgi:hypothetical protein